MALNRPFIELSLVIPFWNEEERLRLFQDSLQDFLQDWLKTSRGLEVICVDDGSLDQSALKIREFLQKLAPHPQLSTQCISYSPNRGKGAALKSGVAQTNGRWVLTLDADMAASPKEFLMWEAQKLIHLDSNTVYFGSREDENSQVEDQFFRRITGRVFNFLIQFLTGLKMRDTQCGFKLYPGQLARELFSKLEEPGWAHDVEIALLVMNHFKSPIVSLPLKWRQVKGSKIRVFSDAPKMFWQILRIRRRVG